MFGMVSATGIGILKNVEMNNRNMLIISVSVSLAVGVSSFPEIFSPLPAWAQMIFSSGLVTGCIASILMNYILPEEKNAA
jgi:xanthine/uracil permease